MTTGAAGPAGTSPAGVDFFVSYTGADEAWATWVAEVLEAEGRTVRVQAWDSPVGENFVSWISDQMDAAARTVALCSPAYFASHWCTQEWTGALAGKKLTPLRVVNCLIPAVLSTIGYRDLYGVDEAGARRRVLEAVGVSRPARVSGGFPGGVAVAPAVVAVFPGRFPDVWGPVPGRNLFFTGRDLLLDRLHDTLAGGLGRVAIAALQGVGGVGKSQLAVEYAWRYAAEYRLVWWVDAETPAGLAAGLAELAGTLGVAAGDVPARASAALAELGRRDGWLLVYDNVTDPATLARVLPPATGRLVVTCRDPGMARVGVDLVEVGEFTRAEALLLLRRHVPVLAGGAGGRLAEALGDLPLAVDQAGAFLAETGMDPDTYLALLADQPDLLLADETLHHPGLVATVTAARTRLGAEHLAAAGLVDRLAFLAAEPIPLTATPSGLTATPSGDGAPVPGALAVGDPLATHTAIGAISRLALARRTGTTLQIHRLVHALLRARLDPEQRRDALTGALHLLATADPGDAEDPAAWPAYAALTPHVAAAAGHLAAFPGLAEPAGFRWLLDRTCWYLHLTGQDRTAHTLATTTRARWSAALGDDYHDSQSITITLAATLAALGDHQGARDLDEDTLARRRRLLGDDHPHTLTTASNLASRLAALGDMPAARDLEEDILARRRRLLGDDHPATLTSASNLAVCLAALGDLPAARDLAEDTLARRRRLLGDDHPDTLASASNLVVRLAALGDLLAARDLAEDTVARRRRVLGVDHPETRRTEMFLRTLDGR